MTKPFVSFNPLRSIGIPNVQHIKPGHMYEKIGEIGKAAIILFPEYWQVNALVYALKKKIFPSVSTYHLGHDKVTMTRAFLALNPGLLPQTVIIAREHADYDRIADQLGSPFVCKVIRSSSGKGVFLIRNHEEWQAYIAANPVVYAQACLDIDRDLRVVIAGDECVSAYWRVKPGDGFHSNLSFGGTIDRTNVPRDITETVVRLAADLGIDYAGFDIALSPQGMHVFEFNMLFGTRGLDITAAELGEKLYRYLNKTLIFSDSTPPPLKIVA